MKEHPHMEVMCHVSNCKFYEKDYCFAPKLEVNPRKGESATSSHEALCSTFVPGSK